METVRCNLKKNDKVKVLSGKEAGKIGQIIKVIKEKNRAIVQGLNMVTRHTKPGATMAEKGGRIQKEAPLAISKLMLVCPKCTDPTRIAYKFVETEGVTAAGKPKQKKVRVCKKCGEQID